MVGHQRGIVGEDGIGQSVIGVGQPFDLGARARHQPGQRLMLGGGLAGIEAWTIVPLRSPGMAHGAGSGAHQNAFQLPGHGLRPECFAHQLLPKTSVAATNHHNRL